MTGREWTIQFPAPYRLLSANGNKPWRETARAKREIRNAVYMLAGHLPTGLERIRVDIDLRFTAARRRDAPNYHPYVGKPCVDAIGPARRVRDARAPGGFRVEPGRGVVPNDTAEFVDGPHITINLPVDRRRFPYGQITLTITDLSGGEHA